MSSSVADEIEALRLRLAQLLDPSAYPSLSEARRVQEEYGTSVPLPPRIERTSVTLGGVPTERLSPDDTKGQQALLFFHSGGYTSGTAADHAALTAHLALAAGAVGYLPEYRRAPEYRFPAAVDDAIDSYRGLLEAGCPAEEIVLAGDSAGGGMAVAVAQQAPTRGLPKPAGIYVLSPWVDLTVTNASYDLRGPHDPMLSRTALADMAHAYLNGADARNPLASPVFGDFSRFPPLLIHVGADEVLLDDASALAVAASRTGTDVTLRVWATMIHMFPWFSSELQTGRAAIEEAGKWIANVMARQQPARR
jgi:monoterpene epsilon-lactone hydrolase